MKAAQLIHLICFKSSESYKKSSTLLGMYKKPHEYGFPQLDLVIFLFLILSPVSQSIWHIAEAQHDATITSQLHTSTVTLPNYQLAQEYTHTKNRFQSITKSSNNTNQP